MTAKNYGIDPATRHKAVSPSNTAVLDPIPRFLYVTTNGNLVIQDESNTAITYPVVAGQQLNFRAYRVLTTTTATVVAWW